MNPLLLELVRCDHDSRYEFPVRQPRLVHLYILKDDRVLSVCGLCGARKESDGRGWHCSELVDALARQLGVTT